MRFLTRSHSVGLAAIALGGGVFLSRIMGLVRDKIISFYFGATPEADIYFMSFVIPDYINYLLAGGYFSITLVPLLTERFQKNEEDGWKFFSTAVCWAFLAIFSLTLVASIFVRPLAELIAPGFDNEAIERLSFFLRIVLPAQVFFLPGACFTAMLYLRRHFTAPALTPLIYNACIIIFGLGFIKLFPDRGMEGFCWGVLCGAAMGSFLLPYIAVKTGGINFRPCLKHKGMKKVLFLALPLMLGQSIVVLDEQFVRIFGSLTGEGSVSLLNYARRIMLVPVGVIAQAAGLASYPFLAALAAKKDYGEFDKAINKTLMATLLVALPVCLWMASAAEPIMRLIFQQGSFSVDNASNSGFLLSIMMAAVIFWSAQQVLGRGFYAFQDMVTPAVCGTLATVLALPLYWLGAKKIGAPGVALAGTLGVALYTIILWHRWKKKYGSGATKGIVKNICLAFILCLPASFAAIGSSHLIYKIVSKDSLGGAFLSILGSGIAFALFYFLILGIFAPHLSRPLSSFCLQILRKMIRTKNKS